MSFDPENLAPPGAKIKVIGVGGGGSNAVNTMIRSKLDGVDFMVCNTDVQALRFSLADTKIQVGKELTRGLGAGADPDIGRDAALEDRHEIQQYLEGADMVFITAGMGGGTGTGGASVVAQIARELGALTVAVVTKPFGFEGKRRRRHAESGIARLRECVDTLITIPNQRLLQVATPGLSMIDAFKMADDVLVNAVRGISDIINIPGTVNVDFADVKTVMSCMGHALMGIGAAIGPNRAVEAAKKAICSPLLEDVDIEGATGILINITAGSDVTLMEINEACSVVQEAAHEDANIFFGAVIDETIGEEIRVTVIATGFPVEATEIDQIEHGRLPSPSIYSRGLHSPGLISTKSTHRPAGAPPALITQAKKQETTRPLVRQPEAPLRREPAFEMLQPEVSPRTPLPTFNPQQTVTPQEPMPLDIEPMSALETNMAEISDISISHESETQDLAQWTMDQSHEFETAEPETVVAIPNEDEDVSFQYGSPNQVAEDTFETLRAEPVVAPQNAESLADGLFDSDADYEVEESEVPAEAVFDRAGALRSNAPLESFFDDQLGAVASDIDKRIDEALELAERMKRPAHERSNDDLDVPAFLRTGLKDLPLD